MDDKARNDSGKPAVTTRAMEIVVALLMFAIGAVVAFDSYRMGSRWADDGPQSGYFPFYIGLIICVCSAITLAQAMMRGSADGGAFVRRGQLRQVVSVLAPAALYVLAIELVGIYVASTVYVAVFMVWLGKYSWAKGLAVGAVTSIAFFAMFEIWFKVPLPKGIFNALGFLGY